VSLNTWGILQLESVVLVDQNKEIKLPFISHGTTEMKLFLELEQNFQLEDELVLRELELRNSVETYAYDVRSKLEGEWSEYLSEEVRDCVTCNNR
jgi:hypothetical protein